MKQVIKLMVFFFLVPVVITNAQETNKTDNYPAWTISKGVQQNQYKNIAYAPAKIKLADVRASLSKDIHKIKNTQPSQKGNVILTGYPTWTISKGVARQQAEKASR